MKEDILEQIVADWQLSKKGCFVKHNIRFRPDPEAKDFDPNKDSVHSDIDILSININDNTVSVFNCISQQGGFSVKNYYENLMLEPNLTSNLIHGHDTIQKFREFVIEKWRKAFINTVYEETKSKKFTYYVACTKIKSNTKNEKDLFEKSPLIRGLFEKDGAEIDIKIITLTELLRDFEERIAKKATNFTEPSAVGRLLQLIDAADLKIR